MQTCICLNHNIDDNIDDNGKLYKFEPRQATNSGFQASVNMKRQINQSTPGLNIKKEDTKRTLPS